MVFPSQIFSEWRYGLVVISALKLLNYQVLESFSILIHMNAGHICYIIFKSNFGKWIHTNIERQPFSFTQFQNFILAGFFEHFTPSHYFKWISSESQRSFTLRFYVNVISIIVHNTVYKSHAFVFFQSIYFRRPVLFWCCLVLFVF